MYEVIFGVSDMATAEPVRRAHSLPLVDKHTRTDRYRIDDCWMVRVFVDCQHETLTQIIVPPHLRCVVSHRRIHVQT
jgi:hypothetical protein